MYLMQINSNVHVGHLHLLFSTKNFIKPKTFDIWSLIRPLNYTLQLSLILSILTLYPTLYPLSLPYILKYKVHKNTHAKTIIDLGVWENIHKPPKVPNS